MPTQRSEDRALTRAAVGTFILTAGLALVLLAAQPACSPRACTQNTLNPNIPSVTLECPGGQVCYLGQCIRSCSAGQERAETCESDDDCSGARPNCVAVDNRSFCSSCDQGELCVPTLDVCRSVTAYELPEPPPTNPQQPQMPPPSPIDGGVGGLDGGLQLKRDAGMVEPPPDQEVTYSGIIDLAQLDDLRTTPSVRTSSVAIRVFSTAGNGLDIDWRVDNGAAKIATVELEVGQCTLSSLARPMNPVPLSDIGPIQIDNTASSPCNVGGKLDPDDCAITRTIDANYDPQMGYLLTYTPNSRPNELLIFSALPSRAHFVAARGRGLDGATQGSFPDPPLTGDDGYHVPFELLPLAESTDLLRAGVRVAAGAAPADLSLLWNSLRTGVVPGEQVAFRLIGDNAEIFCGQIEGQGQPNVIDVPGGMLANFRDRETARNFTFSFERVSAQLIPVVPAEGEFVELEVRVRHSLLSTITFD